MTAGNRTVVTEWLSSAIITIRFRTAKNVKNNNDSENGSLYNFLIVGPNPSVSIVVRITTAHNGSEVKYQNGKEDIAEINNNQSVLVIVISALFIYAVMATRIVMPPETPIGQAPTPALPANCARNTMNVVEPQIIHENTCGFVSPRMIEHIYG